MCDEKQNEDIHEHEQRKVLNIEGPDYGPEDKADTEGTVGNNRKVILKLEKN